MTTVAGGGRLGRAGLEAVARRWIGLWQGGDLAAFDELHDPAFVDRSAAGRATDRDGFRAGLADLYRAFPDFAAGVETLVIDEPGQAVAIRWVAAGSHRRAFMGEEPTRAPVRFEGIEIVRCRGARIVERWGEWDGLAILGQIRAARRTG